jgi:hypothetical protein
MRMRLETLPTVRVGIVLEPIRRNYVAPTSSGRRFARGRMTIRLKLRENWNFGAREHFDADTRFAQGSKALRLLHLYLLNN